MMYSKKKTNQEYIQTATKEKLSKFLEKIVCRGDPPWQKEFYEKFCKTCPEIRGKIEGCGKEYSFHECDFVDGKCPRGADIDWWMDQETKEDE